MHGEEGVNMVGVLLQEGHNVVGVKAGLALLKQHLHCLYIHATALWVSAAAACTWVTRQTVS